MSSLLILAVIALVIQIVMFFVIRSKKQDLEYPTDIEKKYRIRTRADAWKLMNNPELSDKERTEIEDVYKRM